MKDNIVLIVGATGGLGRALAYRFAKANFTLQLCARDIHNLKKLKNELYSRGFSKVSIHELNILDSKKFQELLNSLPIQPDIFIVTVGKMSGRGESERDFELATSIIRTNFEGPVNLISLIADRFEARNSGSIVAVSSLAGERGRASNYVYGASKAGLTLYLDGLRHRFQNTKIQVLTVKPGFIDTNMIAGHNISPKLKINPESAANKIFIAIDKGQKTTCLTPFWRLVQIFLKVCPDFVFKRLSL